MLAMLEHCTAGSHQEIQELMPDRFVVEEAYTVSSIPSVPIANDAAALGSSFQEPLLLHGGQCLS